VTSFLKYLEMGSLTAPWEMFGEILSAKASLLGFIFRAASLFSGLFWLYVAILIELSVPGRFYYTLNFFSTFFSSVCAFFLQCFIYIYGRRSNVDYAMHCRSRTGLPSVL